MDFCAILFTNQLKKNQAFQFQSTSCHLALAREGSCGALVTVSKHRPHPPGLAPSQGPVSGEPEHQVTCCKTCSPDSGQTQLHISYDVSVTKSGGKSYRHVCSQIHWVSFLFVSLLLLSASRAPILKFSITFLL